MIQIFEPRVHNVTSWYYNDIDGNEITTRCLLLN